MRHKINRCWRWWASLWALSLAALQLGAAGEIRVQLRRRHSGEDHIKQLLKCAHLYANSTTSSTNDTNNNGNHADSGYESDSLQDNLIDDGGGAGASCSTRIDLLGNSFSPFFGRIQLGEPPQEFEVLFDTGSDMLWVTHEQCKINGKLVREMAGNETSGRMRRSRRRSLFVESASRTCRRHEKLAGVEVRYGNGMGIKGGLVCDALRLGGGGNGGNGGNGAASESLRVPNQCFAPVLEIYNEDKSEYLPPFDGIVGLSWPRDGSRMQTPTLLENLLISKTIDGKLFAVNMHTTKRTHQSPASEPYAGELTIGKIEPASYVGPMVWVPVARLHHWEIRVDRISVIGGHNDTLAVACQFGCKAIVDTGTAYVVGPESEVGSLNQALGFVPYQSIPSVMWAPDSLAASRADNIRLVFELNGHRLVYHADAFSVRLKHIYVSMLRHVPVSTGGGAVDAAQLWIFGAPFIEKFYTVFDYGQRRIGFGVPAWR